VAELTPAEKWFTLNEQQGSEKTCSAAMATGPVQLQGLIGEWSTGPREENPDPPPPKRNGGLFGFGFGVQRG